MYERSASVLEKYIGKTLIYNSELKENYSYYKDLIALLENYQIASEREITYEKEYKTVLLQVEDIQRKQREISKYNIELENKRNRLFNDSIKAPEEISSSLMDIEKTLKSNSAELEELRVRLIENLKTLNSKKPILKDLQDTTRLENRKFRKALRDASDSYRVITSEQLEWLEEKLIDYASLEDNAIEVMLKNGKDEKVPFNEEAIRNATIFGIDIARKQYEAYIFIYRQTAKLMEEINANKVKLENRKKTLIATDAKIKFLEAEKEYLNHFLDNERLTAIHSVEEHDKNMKDAISKFNFDIEKINSLYNLLTKSTKGKATKEDFKLLYDASHYRGIEEKELNFQKETKKLGIGVAVSPDYWRREGLRSIYDMFSRIIHVIEAKKIAKNQIKVDRIDNITNKLVEEYQDNPQELDRVDEKEQYDEENYEESDEEDYEDTDIEEFDDENNYEEDELLKEEYKYKERIKNLLEQNNMKAELKEPEEDSEPEVDNYDEDDEDDEEDDDVDKSTYEDTRYGKHSIEDSRRRGRHSDDENQKTNIFGKLKNIFDKNKDDDDDDEEDDEYDDADNDDYTDEESNNYIDDEYDDKNNEEDSDIEKIEDEKEREKIRRYEERMNRFEEKMRIKLSENPKLRR